MLGIYEVINVTELDDGRLVRVEKQSRRELGATLLKCSEFGSELIANM